VLDSNRKPRKGVLKMTLEQIIKIAEKITKEERVLFFTYLEKSIKRLAD